MLQVLRNNKGFARPEEWIEYALQHNFQRVSAEDLHACPDCGCGRLIEVGQYIYYSTLVKLQECLQCGLIFADKRIDPRIVQAHFERAYKEEQYFLKSRRRIFKQIARLADTLATRGATVLDIGGAKGHLLATLRVHRPDLSFILNDLSEEACNHAARVYGFRTVRGDASTLKHCLTKYDVAILSDVLYYEANLNELWTSLSDLAGMAGAIIIRVPNKHLPIKMYQLIAGRILGRLRMERRDSVPFLNPEHLYVFSRRYLVSRLKGLGFREVRVVPSELLAGRGVGLWPRVYCRVAQLIFVLSGASLILTPSLLLIAQKPAGGEAATSMVGPAPRSRS